MGEVVLLETSISDTSRGIANVFSERRARCLRSALVKRHRRRSSLIVAPAAQQVKASRIVNLENFLMAVAYLPSVWKSLEYLAFDFRPEMLALLIIVIIVAVIVKLDVR
jgi:hypothetical protein